MTHQGYTICESRREVFDRFGCNPPPAFRQDSSPRINKGDLWHCPYHCHRVWIHLGDNRWDLYTEDSRL